jgi:hypothetical protein
MLGKLHRKAVIGRFVHPCNEPLYKLSGQEFEAVALFYLVKVKLHETPLLWLNTDLRKEINKT